MFSLYNPPTITGLEDLVVLALTGILEFFIVITAILIGYFVYGKDKATGVLDSVLAKPITRGQLILSRYFANAVSLVLMISAIVAIDLAVLYILHSTALPFQFALIVIGGVSATALSYLAFVYLFSSLFRSTGAILALSVVFFVFFALVFSILALVLPLALGYPVGSPAYYQVYADLEYMNPSSLLQIGLDSVIPSLSSLSIPDPSAYGITFLGFVVSAVAWVAAPLFAAYFLATRRD
jgi:ABC-2 type transport system permease protein